MSKGGRIAIALVLGLLAALFGMLYLGSQRDQILGSSEVVRVYVASDDIPANTLLEKDLVTTRAVPQAYLQPQSITVADLPDPDKIKGVTLVPIKSGEQILRTKLYEGAPPPLSAQLKSRPNMVAVGVKVQDLQNVLQGLVKPGDHVDVLASFRFEKSRDEEFTEVRPMYQNVEVLAVAEATAGAAAATTAKAQEQSAAERGIATITLALPPAAAQQIVLAQQLGVIWVLLRAPGDNTQHPYEIWNNERLLQSQYRLWKAQSRDEVLRDMFKK